MRPAFSIAAGPPDDFVNDFLEGQYTGHTRVTAFDTPKTITALKEREDAARLTKDLQSCS